MGLNHARAYARLPGVTLAAVVDIHADRAEAAARAHGGEAMTAATALIGRVDAVTVATPAVTHAAVAGPLLRAGIPCLIEKPLAMTADDCATLIAASNAAVVRVGHIERFNPAFQAFAAKNRGAVTAISGRRLNPPGRAVAIDVVNDLMVHDIDLVLTLKGGTPTGISARRLGRDYVAADLTFADGAVCKLESQRAAPLAARDMTISTTDGVFHLDFLARTMTPGDGVITADALDAELGDFLAACRGHRGRGATAGEAAAALDVARQINAALKDKP